MGNTTGMTTSERSGGVRRRVAAIALAAAGAIALIGPSAAHAFSLSDLSAQPAPPPSGTTQAGANSDFNINVAFAAGDVENLRIGLPPGLVGNPLATVKCTSDQLQSNSCPAASQVGETTVNATITVIAIPVTLDIAGKLYNLEPGPGEPARFGIVLQPNPVPPLPAVLPPVILESSAQLRQSDLGLDTVIEDIPNTTEGLPTHINEMNVTLFGNPPGGTKPFIRNPTSCGTATTLFTADPHGSATETTGTASFTPVNCGALPFSPEFSASVGAPGLTASGTKPPLTTNIEQTIEEAGLKRARVILPTNIGSDANLLATPCPEPDFEAGNCPQGTIVGIAVATSPLLEEQLVGPVAIVEGSGTPVPRLGLDLTGPLAMKLAGTFVLGAGTGVEFNGLPDIPISSFALTFTQDALVVNPTDLCDGAPRLFSTEFEGHNGAFQSGSAAATIEGCSGSGPAGGVTGKKKCKKKKKRKGKSREAAAAKKKKKCKRKKRKK